MRKLKKPDLSVSEVFDVCVSIAKNGELSKNCLTAKDAITRAEILYENRAASSELYRMRRDRSLFASATKENLATLYTRLRDNKNARSIYEGIRKNAAPGKCPYCGSGTIGTLDHYLPKMRYPLFTITPANLVPSCERCNGKKRDELVVAPDKQILHPYFDEFWDERWLFAEINCQIPVSANFFVKAPAGWSPTKRKRVEAHFDDLDLDTVFISDAANELSGVKDELEEILRDGTSAGLRKHLKRRADSHFSNCPNGWQTALYHACAESDWFCDGGFLGK
jgi:5-methylcytosine-specific restriction endonuclease McrA